jgi:hypothetical protein
MAKTVYQISNKSHPRYKNTAGVVVPGVSTISNVMDKPQLVPWANRLGLDGIDSTKYVDSLAKAGTLAHYFVEVDLREMERDQKYLDEFSKIDQDLAETSFIKYLEWKGQHEIVLLGAEIEIISDKLRCGGRLDTILSVDGVTTLVDVKTCKALYGDGDDKWCQVAGYKLLAEEAGYEIPQSAILRLGREPKEGFEFAIMQNPEAQVKRFLICRDLYEVNKVLRKS